MSKAAYISRAEGRVTELCRIEGSESTTIRQNGVKCVDEFDLKMVMGPRFSMNI